MTTTRLAPVLALLSLLATTHACGYTSHADVIDAALADAGAGCPIVWLDETPIARSRTRLVEPALTGDREGFLFVTAGRVPDRCEDAPCVILERFPSTGSGSDVAAPFRATGERIALFAGTDSAGAGHFAAAMQSEADELVWGSAPPSREEPSRLALDPSRGLGAVAFDIDAVWALTHAWMDEGTIGEGHEYPIAPQILRAVRDGSSTIEPGPDSTEGLLFVDAALALSDRGAWLVTNGFYGGPLRAAGPGWSGTLREHALGGRHAVAADRDGAIVVADTFDGVLAIARIHEDGLREAGPPSREPVTANVALARSGERFVVAHRADDGPAHVTVLDASLAVVAAAPVPGTASLDQHALLRVAAASDGTFAVLVAPFPVSADPLGLEPVDLRRFRACE